MRRIFLALLLIPIAAWADETARHSPEQREFEARHFIIETEHVLNASELSEFAARGVEVQHVLPQHRYLVRAVSADELGGDLRVRKVVAYTASKKIDRSAYRAAARGKAFASVRLIFHDDVSYDDAQRAIEQVGGTVDRPLAVDFELPHRVVARVPPTAITQLADDERVFAIYGPPLHPAVDNAVAAQLSHVTPLYSTPYNLSGNGVALSLFELADADTTHPEFGGRLTAHFKSGSVSDANHATHVSGTIMAAGLEPRAKGMSPAATLHEFNALDDYAVMLQNKQNTLPTFFVMADNNSWGFQLGWQPNTSGEPPGEVWFGGEEFFGGYDGFYSAPYDKMARSTSVLFVHSAGNDGSEGQNPVSAPWFPHAHADDNGNVITGETFCYSQNGSRTDCSLATCSSGPKHCENLHHPTYGPFTTMGVLSSTKNVIAVGAVDATGGVAAFSSRGPTRDGRVKPDIVAKGVAQFSTVPNGGYRQASGTSMSSPVITGICGLLTEQWRRTFNGQNPTAELLKMLLIAGADDLGNPGPDYTYGFGLANAKASVDLIIADNNTGSRIRTDDITQGQQIETTFALSTAQDVRVVLGWADPEVLLSPDDLATKTLVNDLDVKIIDPSGNAVLPYVLDMNDPNAPATRGVNTVDNTEEIEIHNAAPGNYRVVINGTNVAAGPTQRYVLIANAPLGTTCTDQFEPNDTEATASGPLASSQTILARTCSATDVDFYKINVTAVGPLTVSVTATDTPLRVTLSGNGITPVVVKIAAGATGTVSTQVSTPPAIYLVKVEPTGTIGPNTSYTLTPTYSFVIPPKKRPTRH